MKWPLVQHSAVDSSNTASLMERRMAAFDWAATPLGPIERWPASLKSTVRLLLDCRLPMYLAWGTGFTQLYNDAYVPILGHKDGEALGNDARVTWHEIWPTIGPMWTRVLQGEGIGFERYKLTIERYGYPEDCYFSFSYSPVPDDAGRPAGVLVTFAETTHEVLAERRQAFQLMLSDALRGLDDPVVISERAVAMLGDYLGAGRAGYGQIDEHRDAVSVARDWNDGTMASLAGESRLLDSFGPEIIAQLRAGRTLRLDDTDADPRSAPFAAGYASIGTKSLLVVPLVKGSALVAILYLHCAATRHWTDADVAIAEDVAQRTWDAIERAHAQRALLLADRRKDEFLAMLAHELRNPLAPIRSAAQLLESGRLDPARVADTGRVVSRQATHMSALLDDLLDVSRVTRGLIELRLSPVDLRCVVDSALEQLAPKMQARGHRVAFPRPADPVVVHGDAVRLVQVVANCLSNSARYSPDGASIVVSLSTSGDRARLKVADNGHGISADLLPHVFELFVQENRTLGRAQGGLGIGLALVKALVELHRGRVSVASEGAGRGTTVAIELPIDRETAPASSTRAGIEGGEAATLRVLVVDDNTDAAALLGMLVELRGHKVTTVANGTAALAAARNGTFDVVILDIGLPDIDGYELIGHMRAATGAPGPCFIALTGYGRVEDVDRASAAGFWRHLTKPAPIETLLGYLSEIGRQLAGKASGA